MEFFNKMCTAIANGVTSIVGGITQGLPTAFNNLFVDSSGSTTDMTNLAYGFAIIVALTIGLAGVRFVSRIFSW